LDASSIKNVGKGFSGSISETFESIRFHSLGSA
jgi:hypothetical protein